MLTIKRDGRHTCEISAVHGHTCVFVEKKHVFCRVLRYNRGTRDKRATPADQQVKK